MRTSRAKGTEAAGMAALAGLVIVLLALTWRRWCNPLVDFGRELYIPWRLSEGAVLYRDVDDFYGPLSQYRNAALFRVFGPGLMVLVWANLAIFGGIVATLYALLRAGFGWIAALAGCACFVAVFGFAEFFWGNFNYAAPYSHEATHGVLVCLLLAFVMLRWVKNPGTASSAAAGFLVGLAAVLKAEILLASFAVGAIALGLRLRSSGRVPAGSVVAGVIAAVLPTAAFALWFGLRVPWSDAVRDACRGWITVFAGSRYVGDVVQIGFLGFDHPWRNLASHGFATGCAVAGMLAVVLACRGAGALPAKGWRFLAAGVCLIAIAALASYVVNWLQIGRCLLGVVLIFLGVTGRKVWRRLPEAPEAPAQNAKVLVAVLGAALMARMVLNGRIYHFGFYQAGVAGAVVAAVFAGELAAWVGENRFARRLALASALVVLAIGSFQVERQSLRNAALMTYPVGEGRDRFFTLPPQIESTGYIVNLISSRLRLMPAGQAVLVLPEGEMINYLSRRACPVAPFFFFSAALSDGREARLVQELDARPPDWVVLISRDLREYGIRRYGEAPGKGALLLDWVRRHYEKTGWIGADPLDPTKVGAILFSHKR